MNAATAHAAFVEQRRAYLGGTDISAIIGVNPWATPLSVYMDKVQPEQAEDKDSLPMRRGLVLERFIADEFERTHPGLVCYRHKPIVRTDWGFPAGASLDFLVARVDKPRTPIGELDSKTAFSFYSRGQWKAPDPNRGYDEGDLPDGYFTQQQWYLAVTGLPMAWASADVGDDSLITVPIKPRPKVQAKLIEAGLAFWTDHVLAGVPPEPTGEDADAEALKRMFPDTIPDPPVYLEDPESEALLSDYLAHKFKAEEAKRLADEAKQKLQLRMGEHETAVVGGWKLRWHTVTQNRIDAKALRANEPELAAKYMKPVTSRRFDEPKELS